MIYLEPTTLGWRPIKTSWIKSLPEVLTKTNGEFIDDLMELLIDPCMTFIKKNCREYVQTSQINLIRSFMYLVEILLTEPCEAEDVADNRHLRTWLLVSTCTMHTFITKSHFILCNCVSVAFPVIHMHTSFPVIPGHTPCVA